MENEKIVRTVIHPGQQPTEAQIREIELAASLPVMPDEDAPELTLEQYAEMAAIARNRRSQRVKPVVALRISPETLDRFNRFVTIYKRDGGSGKNLTEEFGKTYWYYFYYAVRNENR
jgi:hypothetical protein